MNLPNYFLADLPPEAELTAGLITEACQTLKRNREQYLEGRTTESLIRLLDRVAGDWLSADFPFRLEVLKSGPAATGRQVSVHVRSLLHRRRRVAVGPQRPRGTDRARPEHGPRDGLAVTPARTIVGVLLITGKSGLKKTVHLVFYEHSLSAREPIQLKDGRPARE